ncbi:hypothetical protein EDC01DRAFT_626554 [Geopyxis carbonaria]|nr:hypothetical protein EDC01DRAFT_626554 [Geopyxis carbonaria]
MNLCGVVTRDLQESGVDSDRVYAQGIPKTSRQSRSVYQHSFFEFTKSVSIQIKNHKPEDVAQIASLGESRTWKMPKVYRMPATPNPDTTPPDVILHLPPGPSLPLPTPSFPIHHPSPQKTTSTMSRLDRPEPPEFQPILHGLIKLIGDMLVIFVLLPALVWLWQLTFGSDAEQGLQDVEEMVGGIGGWVAGLDGGVDGGVEGAVVRGEGGGDGETMDEDEGELMEEERHVHPMAAGSRIGEAAGRDYDCYGWNDREMFAAGSALGLGIIDAGCLPWLGTCTERYLK